MHPGQNAIFRIGGELAARFPLQPDEPGSVRRRLEAEAAAARTLAGRTRFPTPRRWPSASPERATRVQSNLAMSRMGRRALERIQAGQP